MLEKPVNRPFRQIQKIDDFLLEHYKEYGPNWCATRLEEPKDLIVQRAFKLCLRYKPPEHKNVSTSTTKADLEAMNRYLKGDNQRLRNWNKELRQSLIAVVDENRMLKGLKNAC